jgi:hypothetical protein
MTAYAKSDSISNSSIGREKVRTEGRLTYTELIRQEYGGNNCVISAGFVEGDDKPEVDTCYLRLEKDGVEPTVLLLRPDELQSIAWVASGAVWSHLINVLHDAPEDGLVEGAGA